MNGDQAVKALGLALRSVRGEGPRVAMCPLCPDAVLVATFRWPGAEFYCLDCEGLFSFVDPRPEQSTPELDTRIEAAERLFAERFPLP